MGWAERQNKQNAEKTAVIIFPNDELRDEYSDFMKRMRLLLISTGKFFDAGASLDEDDPNLSEKMAPHLENFIVDLILTFGDKGQFLADLETLGAVRVLTNKK